MENNSRPAEVTANITIDSKVSDMSIRLYLVSQVIIGLSQRRYDGHNYDGYDSYYMSAKEMAYEAFLIADAIIAASAKGSLL